MRHFRLKRRRARTVRPVSPGNIRSEKGHRGSFVSPSVLRRLEPLEKLVHLLHGGVLARKLRRVARVVAPVAVRVLLNDLVLVQPREPALDKRARVARLGRAVLVAHHLHRKQRVQLHVHPVANRLGEKRRARVNVLAKCAAVGIRHALQPRHDVRRNARDERARKVGRVALGLGNVLVDPLKDLLVRGRARKERLELLLDIQGSRGRRATARNKRNAPLRKHLANGTALGLGNVLGNVDARRIPRSLGCLLALGRGNDLERLRNHNEGLPRVREVRELGHNRRKRHVTVGDCAADERAEEFVHLRHIVREVVDKLGDRAQPVNVLLGREDARVKQAGKQGRRAHAVNLLVLDARIEGGHHDLRVVLRVAQLLHAVDGLGDVGDAEILLQHARRLLLALVARQRRTTGGRRRRPGRGLGLPGGARRGRRLHGALARRRL
eukprot:Opistho-1_new@22290